MRSPLQRVWRLWLGGLLLVPGLLLGPMQPHAAHAIWGNCLDDPIVWLSNGAKIDLATSIAAPAGAVLAVDYVLHVAPGVTPDHIVPTRGLRPYAENLIVINDAASGHIRSDTTVLMVSKSGTAVQTTTSIKQGPSGSASGSAGQVLTVNL